MGLPFPVIWWLRLGEETAFDQSKAAGGLHGAIRGCHRGTTRSCRLLAHLFRIDWRSVTAKWTSKNRERQAFLFVPFSGNCRFPLLAHHGYSKWAFPRRLTKPFVSGGVPKGHHFVLVADGRLRASDKITVRSEGVGEWLWVERSTRPHPLPLILSLALSLPSATSTKWRPCRCLPHRLRPPATQASPLPRRRMEGGWLIVGWRVEVLAAKSRVRVWPIRFERLKVSRWRLH